MDRQTDGRMVGRTDGWTDGQMVEGTDECVDILDREMENHAPCKVAHWRQRRSKCLTYAKGNSLIIE